MFCQGDGHGETKMVGGGHGCHIMLLDMLGGYTLQVRNPDSWEGWYWGAKHVWGMEPIGLQQPYNANVFPDILKNTVTSCTGVAIQRLLPGDSARALAAVSATR